MQGYVVRQSREYSTQINANSIQQALDIAYTMPIDAWDIEVVEPHVDTDDEVYCLECNGELDKDLQCENCRGNYHA